MVVSLFVFKCAVNFVLRFVFFTFVASHVNGVLLLNFGFLLTGPTPSVSLSILFVLDLLSRSRLILLFQWMTSLVLLSLLSKIKFLKIILNHISNRL